MNGAATAATAATAAGAPLSVSSLAQLTLSLLAIVALILALSWVLKRFKLAGARGRGDLAVIDQLAVGPRERILLIRVGDSQLLVGVGAGGVVGLSPLPAPLVANDTSAPAFADRLRDLMKRTGSAS